MNTRFFIKIIVLWVFTGAYSGIFAQQGQILLKIGTTTDIHGAYFPNDWYTGKPIAGSLSQVYTWAQEQRHVPGQTLILLDNGDLVQGDPAAYYSNAVDIHKPNIAARILNFMGYEAASVGNHDMETGHLVYDQLAREYRFPWLMANGVSLITGEPVFKPYTILEHAGIRIGILGITTPKIPDWLPPALWSGLEFRGMVETAKKWSEYILTQEKPDILIGLFHAGVDATYGNQSIDDPLNENASEWVARKVPGFQIIFVGHDHKSWNFKVADPNGDSVLILGSVSRAAEIAVASITLKKQDNQDNRYRITSVTGTHQKIKDYPPDPEFMKKFSGYIDTIQQYVDQPVGTITRRITADDAYFGPSAFVSLIHRAQLDLTGADVSFTAPLSFRSELAPGILTVKDLFRLYRFENQLYTIQLTGAEIAGYLNYSYSIWMKTMTGPDDLMLNMEQQKDGSWKLKNAYYNFDSAAGIDYIVDLSKPAGQMVTITQMSNGQPFNLNKNYTVALNSYRGSGGGNHLRLGAGLSKEAITGRLIRASEKDFRLLFTEWVRKQRTIDPVALQNWKTVPEPWILVAAPRDAQRLFKERN